MDNQWDSWVTYKVTCLEHLMHRVYIRLEEEGRLEHVLHSVKRYSGRKLHTVGSHLLSISLQESEERLKQDSMNSFFLRISSTIYLYSYNLSIAIFFLQILPVILEAQIFGLTSNLILALKSYVYNFTRPLGIKTVPLWKCTSSTQVSHENHRWGFFIAEQVPSLPSI